MVYSCWVTAKISAVCSLPQIIIPIYTVRYSVLYSPHLQDTVHKLLSGFFKEEKTKRELYKSCPDLSDFPQTVCILVVILSLNKSLCVTVSGDAALLMAEMLKIFVEGKKFCWVQLQTVWDTMLGYPVIKLFICYLIFRGRCKITETSWIWGLRRSRDRALWKDPTSAGAYVNVLFLFGSWILNCQPGFSVFLCFLSAFLDIT